VKKNRPGILARILANLLLLLNLGAIAWLCLCAAAAYISPAELEYISLFSLTTPFAIVANIFFVLLWLFSRPKLRALLSIVALVGCYKVTTTIFGLNFFRHNDLTPGPNKVKIISWNVHGMGIFNKPVNKQFDSSLIEFIKKEDADILCFPEFYTPRKSVLEPFTGKILQNNGYIDYRFNIDNPLNTIYLGTAIFSKYTLKNYEAHELSPYIYLLQGDILFSENNILRVFFLHLTSFGLSDKDKAYIEEAKKRNTDIDNDLGKSRSFISKFNNAFTRRAAEAEKAAAIIAASPYPVLIAGDFNDLPGSYTYTTLRGNLKDAFLEQGIGLGRTYNMILPTIRIDHIFYDPTALRLTGFTCPYTPYSDHNPVITNFEILEKPRQ
jgi:endonuclease/exonuclease/phosphatase family metal-dependent hydrolase